MDHADARHRGPRFDELVARALRAEEDLNGPAVFELGRIASLRVDGGPELALGLRWLSDPTPERRGHAAYLLATFGQATLDDGRAVPPVVEDALLAAAGTETDPDVVSSLVIACCRCRTRRALPWLVSLSTGADRDVVETLASCLPDVDGDDPRVVGCLEGLLDHPDEVVRDWAGFAFAHPLSTADTPTLHAKLLDLAATAEAEPVTRYQAILALAVRRDRRVVPLLAAALLVPLTEDEARLVSFDDLEEAAALLPDQTLLPGLRAWAHGTTGPPHSSPHPDEGPDPAVLALIHRIEAMGLPAAGGQVPSVGGAAAGLSGIDT